MLTEQLAGLAARQPVLVLLEDAHWIDPTTMELAEQCLDRIVDCRALIVLTSRPHQQPAFAAHRHLSRLALGRLDRSSATAMVARVSGESTLSAETIDAIVARADGLPLFIEELTKAVVETGQTSVPVSLHDSLIARRDRC